MKRILLVGFCFLLSCSVALIGVNAADDLAFNVSSVTMDSFSLNGTNQYIDTPVASSLPYTFWFGIPGVNFDSGDTLSTYFTVEGSFPIDPVGYTYLTAIIDFDLMFNTSISSNDISLTNLYFATGDGYTFYSDFYTVSQSQNNFIISWAIDTSGEDGSLPPFGFGLDIKPTASGNLESFILSEFQISASLPEGPNYEDAVIGGLDNINDKLTQILVNIDSEELAALIEDKLRQSDVGTVPESPIDQGEIDELESVEDNLFNLADEKKQSFTDALNTWQGAFSSGGGGGKIGVVTGSIFNKILAIPFIRDLVYLSLGFGLITFTLRLGRKLV